MDTISNSTELIRIVFLIGAIAALMYKKQFGVTPGGIIVPGVLAVIFFASIPAFIISVLAGLLCRLLYKIFFSKYALTGRWPAIVNIAISAIITVSLLALYEAHQNLDKETILLSLVVPGLFALSSRKYGIGKVSIGTAITTFATVITGLALASIVPLNVANGVSVNLIGYEPLVLVNPFVVLSVSLATAVSVYALFRARGAGYLIAPFLAVVITSSVAQAILLAAGIAFSYTIVRLIQKQTLVIGLERFVLSLFCGYVVVTFLDVLASYSNIPGYRTDTLVLMIAVAVITNDLCLQPLRTSMLKGISPALLVAVVTKVAI